MVAGLRGMVFALPNQTPFAATGYSIRYDLRDFPYRELRGWHHVCIVAMGMG